MEVKKFQKLIKKSIENENITNFVLPWEEKLNQNRYPEKIDSLFFIHFWPSSGEK